MSCFYLKYTVGGFFNSVTRPFIPTIGQPTAADNNNEPYLPYFRYLLSRENADLPQVISNSYGDQEDVCTWRNFSKPQKAKEQKKREETG